LKTMKKVLVALMAVLALGSTPALAQPGYYSPTEALDQRWLGEGLMTLSDAL
jgi:hypothetical protein